ncbi:TRAP transporter large permease [Clostridium malenominatum]|uniref:TRAP transporter large permease n=1 Tax=Clostridium malenominatum TaxID=1539 RepID=A0ABP3TXV1_9CLOT
MGLVVIVFVVFLLLGMPIAFMLGLTGVAHLFAIGNPTFLSIIPQRMFGGVNQFSLLCIPFFVLAGDLMNKGGITERIMGFVRECVGFLRGGLAYAAVIVAMILSAILGSANAVAAILCAVLIAEMKKDGYDEDFSASLIASSGVLGPIIPPSVTFILYSVLTGTSVNKMFIAGIVPGILIGLGYILVIRYYTKKRNYPKIKEKFEPKEVFKAFVKAAPSLVVPVVIVGGVLGGVFTPTESGAVAVAIALISGLAYRTLKISELPEILLNTGITTAAIMFIVAFGNIIGWTLAIDQLPAKMAQGILGVTTNKNLVMLMILLALIIIGCVMEAFAALLIFVPVFAPIAKAVGIDPIHFGIIFSVMINIGLITPPVGMLLFVTSNISKVPLGKINKAILPFVGVAFVVTFILAFVPDLVMFLPNLIAK